MATAKVLSPIDLQSARFNRSLWGFDKEEVRLFLQAAAESYQETAIENREMKKTIEHLKASLAEFHKREDILRDALYAAQKMSGEIKAQASREAQTIIQGAELKGDTLLRQAQLRAHELERSIVDLKLERNRALDVLSDLTRRVQSMIEAIEEKRDHENVASFGKES